MGTTPTKKERAEVKARGRAEALTNARKRRKKTNVLLEKPYARDGEDRTGKQRQDLGSEFEFGSQASDCWESFVK